MIRNPFRFAIIGGLGNLFNILGMLIITASVTAYSYIMCTMTSLKDKIHSPIIVVIICFLVGYIVA